jgi:hypothetical protein
MALYLTKRTKNFIMLGVIVVSVIIALRGSKILDSLLKPPQVATTAALEKGEQLFREYKYETKLDVRFVAQNIGEIKNEVDDLINNNKLNVMYSIKKGNNVTKLVELPKDRYIELLSSLRASPDLVSDELMKSEESASVEDLKRRELDAKNYKKILSEKLNAARTPYERENTQISLDKQNNIIDSLNAILKLKAQREDYILAKIDISGIEPKGSGGAKSFQTFALTFIESFVFITIALLICYLLIAGLSRLFVVLGIKTRHGTDGRYGSGAYGYGDYSYGGYGERRIKRKYIRKPKPEDEKPESDSKGQEANNSEG